MKLQKLPAKILNKFIQRIFIAPPYSGWAEQVREMLTGLATLRIDYAHYHGVAMDSLVERITVAETALTDLLIELGTAEKELENEVERTT